MADRPPDDLKEAILLAMNDGKWEKNSGITLLGNFGIAMLRCNYPEIAYPIFCRAIAAACQLSDPSSASISFTAAVFLLGQARRYLECAIEAPLPLPDDSYPLEVKERVEKNNQKLKEEWKQILEAVSMLSCFSGEE